MHNQGAKRFRKVGRLRARRSAYVALAVVTVGALVLSGTIANADNIPPGQAKKASPSPSPTKSPDPTATPTPTPTGSAVPSSAPAPSTSTTATAPAPTPTLRPHDLVYDFDTPIALGQWPKDGTAPAAYPNLRTYPDGTAGKYYPSQVLSVHDGMLDYYDHNSMAAAVVPFGYAGFTYGTYTVRMKLSGTYPGYHNAFLLWPNSNQWPADGEFDFPENETSATHAYVAVVQDDRSFLPSQKTYAPAAWTDGNWHNYTIQWAPGEVRFYQDGNFITKVNQNVPDTPMHPVMQNEFSWMYDGSAKPPADITGHTYVDRVTYDRSYTIDPANFG
jgi:hypothetical protein